MELSVQFLEALFRDVMFVKKKSAIIITPEYLIIFAVKTTLLQFVYQLLLLYFFEVPPFPFISSRCLPWAKISYKAYSYRRSDFV